MSLKAPEHSCHSAGPCSKLNPAELEDRGVCSKECRRSWHCQEGKQRELAAQREEWEERQYQREIGWYGKRKADQLRRKRAAAKESR
jgi:hypothetical protein